MLFRRQGERVVAIIDPGYAKLLILHDFYLYNMVRVEMIGGKGGVDEGIELESMWIFYDILYCARCSINAKNR